VTIKQALMLETLDCISDILSHTFLRSVSKKF